MLTSIEGTYRNGHIELKEPPVEIQNETPVIVTFLGSNDLKLRTQGIGPTQAAQLRSALSTFEDWSEPSMENYNDYDAAKSNL